MDTRQDKPGQPAGQRQDGVELAAAAKTLNLTVETVRKRLQRGKIKGWKAEDGTWRVVLPRQDKPGQEAGQEQDKPGQIPPDLVSTLRDEIAFLREQLRARDEEVHRAHVLLQASQQQVLQLTDQRQVEQPAPERRGLLARIFGR